MYQGIETIIFIIKLGLSLSWKVWRINDATLELLCYLLSACACWLLIANSDSFYLITSCRSLLKTKSKEVLFLNLKIWKLILVTFFFLFYYYFCYFPFNSSNKTKIRGNKISRFLTPVVQLTNIQPPYWISTKCWISYFI